MSSIAKAVVFWGIAILLSLLTIALGQIPGWVWALRIFVILIGIGLKICLIARENSRKSHGLPLDRDSSAFDLWTVAHTMAGLVMGASGTPFPLVVIFTIAWEIFEFLVPGFGDTEIFSNRVVDIGVGWVG